MSRSTAARAAKVYGHARAEGETMSVTRMMRSCKSVAHREGDSPSSPAFSLARSCPDSCSSALTRYCCTYRIVSASREFLNSEQATKA